MKKSPRSKKKAPEERSPFWWLRWVPTVVISFLVHLFSLRCRARRHRSRLCFVRAGVSLKSDRVQAGVKRGLSRTFSAIAAISVGFVCHWRVYDLRRSRSVGGKHKSRTADRRQIHARKRRPSESISAALFARAGTGSGR